METSVYGDVGAFGPKYIENLIDRAVQILVHDHVVIHFRRLCDLFGCYRQAQIDIALSGVPPSGEAILEGAEVWR